MKNWKEISEENLKNEPKHKTELIKKIKGVEIWKHTYYLANIRKFPSIKLIDRILNLPDFWCVGWEEHFEFRLLYKKNNKCALDVITEDMFLESNCDVINLSVNGLIKSLLTTQPLVAKTNSD